MLRILGAVGVALGGAAYLASFYTHAAWWRWSGVAIILVGALAVVGSRLIPRTRP